MSSVIKCKIPRQHVWNSPIPKTRGQDCIHQWHHAEITSSLSSLAEENVSVLCVRPLLYHCPERIKQCKIMKFTVSSPYIHYIYHSISVSHIYLHRLTYCIPFRFMHVSCFYIMVFSTSPLHRMDYPYRWESGKSEKVHTELRTTTY